MNRYLIGLLFSSILTFAINAQETSGPNKVVDTIYTSGKQQITKYTDGSQSIKLVKSNSHKSPTKRHFDSPQEEIQYLNNYIAALEGKKSHVISTEDIHSEEIKAWIIEIDGFISSSQNRIEELNQQIIQESTK